MESALSLVIHSGGYGMKILDIFCEHSEPFAKERDRDVLLRAECERHAEAIARLFNTPAFFGAGPATEVASEFAKSEGNMTVWVSLLGGIPVGLHPTPEAASDAGWTIARERGIPRHYITAYPVFADLSPFPRIP